MVVAAVAVAVAAAVAPGLMELDLVGIMEGKVARQMAKTVRMELVAVAWSVVVVVAAAAAAVAEVVRTVMNRKQPTMLMW